MVLEAEDKQRPIKTKEEAEVAIKKFIEDLLAEEKRNAKNSK